MQFRIITNEIQCYQDADLSIPQNLEIAMDTIVSGNYVNQNVVFIDEPHNVYCAADRVEPVDTEYAQYSAKTQNKNNAGVEPTEEVEMEIPEMEPVSNVAYGASLGEGYAENPNYSGNGYAEEQAPSAYIAAQDNQKASEKIQYGFGNFGSLNVGYFSTGDLLEDCDNLLRMYRTEDNVRRRENLYDDFWAKYNELKKTKPLDVLRIPSKVRGFLEVLPHFPEYQQDEIIRGVLSKNGLLADPDYIQPRYIVKVFVYYEFWNYFKWFMLNLRSFRAWMFMFLFMLSVTIFVYIPVAFFEAQIWRAIMLEVLFPFSCLSCVLWADTPFTARVIRRQMEEESAALGTVPGRALYNGLLLFFCLSSVRINAALLVIIAVIVAFWTLIMYILVERFRQPAKYVRIATGHPTKLREKFVKYDQDRDGILNIKELRAFFDSYRQEVSAWQMEVLLLQYDLHGDGGVRFDGLTIWLQKIPLDADTKMQALNNVPNYISPSINDIAAQPNNQLTPEELARAREYGFQVEKNNAPQELELAEVNAP